MNLVWKLLRRHISSGQFVGFALANLVGMFIVLLGVQFYRDVVPLFTAEDSFLKDETLVVSKHISAAGSLTASDNTFSEEEITEMARQPFCKHLGVFHSSQYKVSAAMSVGGAEAFSTDLFFDAIPDEFVGADTTVWHYTMGSSEIPIILPRSYLALYNFGFAQSRGLPKLSEGLAGLIRLRIIIHAEGHHDQFAGRVIGFSNRINTILVPLEFIMWSNARYAPNGDEAPSRVVMAVGNPTDDRINTFMDKHAYEVEDSKLEAGKMTFFLKIVIALVLSVGLLISGLSFYILMLSIFLLVQKNSEKLENLLLIGYSPSRVARPYQLLTLGMNVFVALVALAALALVRRYYLGLIALIYPQVEVGGMLPAVVVAIVLLAVVSLFNMWAIRRKIMHIWNRKE